MVKSIITIMLFIILASSSYASSVEFIGFDSQHNSKPIQSGQSIIAFDNDGVKCGETIVEKESKYTLRITGDDPLTDEDEGAEPGDRITLYIDGKKAIVVKGEAVWTEDGDQVLVEIVTPEDSQITGLVIKRPEPLSNSPEKIMRMAKQLIYSTVPILLLSILVFGASHKRRRF